MVHLLLLQFLQVLIESCSPRHLIIKILQAQLPAVDVSVLDSYVRDERVLATHSSSYMLELCRDPGHPLHSTQDTGWSEEPWTAAHC